MHKQEITNDDIFIFTALIKLVNQISLGCCHMRRGIKATIDIYATSEEEDNSDECEVTHERSESAKTQVRIILFLPCSILHFVSCMHRNGLFFCLKRGKKIPFLGYIRRMLVRRFDRDNFAPIVGFHIDAVGNPQFQVFSTNLHFGPLDGDT